MKNGPIYSPSRDCYNSNQYVRSDREIIAYGFFVFKCLNGADEVLFIKNTRGEYGPPKGNAEFRQAPLEAAAAELKEETGLGLGADIELIKCEPIKTTPYKTKKGLKSIVLFVGECHTNKEPHPLDIKYNDAVEARWYSIEDALELLKRPVFNQKTKKHESYEELVQPLNNAYSIFLERHNKLNAPETEGVVDAGRKLRV